MASAIFYQGPFVESRASLFIRDTMMWCAWQLSAAHWAPAFLNQNSSNKWWKTSMFQGQVYRGCFPEKKLWLYIYISIFVDILRWDEITSLPWNPKGKFEDVWSTLSEKGQNMPIIFHTPPLTLTHLIPWWSSQGSLIISRRSWAKAGSWMCNWM